MKYNGNALPDTVTASVLTFAFTYFTLFGLIALVLGMLGLDALTALSAAAAGIAMSVLAWVKLSVRKKLFRASDCG